MQTIPVLPDYPLNVLLSAVLSAKAAGWTDKDFELFTNPDRATTCLAAVRDQLSVLHAVDCNTKPHEPKGLKFDRNYYGTYPQPIIWEPSAIKLVTLEEFVEAGQIETVFIGHSAELIPANVLDYLLHHPKLVTPEMTKHLEENTDILFAGSRYQHGSFCAFRAMSRTEEGNLAGASHRVQDKSIRGCMIALRS
ncbi:MAG: hypothetical protein V4509_02945 [Patescibacteria group bacterium]